MSAGKRPGVMLQGRSQGLHHYDDEVRTDHGTKAKARRRVRRREKHRLETALRTERDL